MAEEQSSVTADPLEGIKAMAEDLKAYSLQMMAFNIEQAKLGVGLDVISKITNNFMNKPDKIGTTQ